MEERVIAMIRAPALDTQELAVLGQIDDLKERLRGQLHEPHRWASVFGRLTFARTLRGSNSIEGFNAALDDAAAVALREEPLDADEKTRLALAGYRDAMAFVLQLAADDDLTHSAQLLKSLHFMMTSYQPCHRPGRWRAGSVYVRKEQTGEVVYEGPDVDLVPRLVDELAEHLNDSARESEFVRAAFAHLNLMLIRPFHDDNGRLARCLQSLTLAREEAASPVFVGIEEYLGHHADAYHDVLATVGQGSWPPGEDSRPWLRFMLTGHLRQAKTMLRRSKETERLWMDLERVVARHRLPGRTMAALFDAASGLRVRNATYRAVLVDTDEGITEQTATRDLKELVEAGLLVGRGQSRGRYYTAGNELMAIRRQILANRDPRDDSDPFA